MLKKTLGLIAVLILIIAGEGVWLSQLNLQSIWQSELSSITKEMGKDSVRPPSSTLDRSIDGSEIVDTSSEVPESPVASLGDATGSVTITHDGEELDATPFMALIEGDMIQTGADGSAEIAWSGFGRTILSANTSLTISRAEHGASSDGIIAKMKLESGRVWTRLEKLLSTGSSFEVKASNVVATVRGTSFGVGLDTPGNVDIKVAESHVDVSRTVSADSDEVVGSTITMQPMQRMLMVENETSLPKPEAMTKSDIEQDKFLMKGNQAVPQEYLDLEWMAFVEMILSQIPPDQLPADFNRAEFMEYMRQVQAQFPDELKQQYMQEMNGGTYSN